MVPLSDLDGEDASSKFLHLDLEEGERSDLGFIMPRWAHPYHTCAGDSETRTARALARIEFRFVPINNSTCFD